MIIQFLMDILAGFDVATTLNLIGLIFITIGGIMAAKSCPQPQYGIDGSVSLSGEPDRNKRIRMHHQQNRFGNYLKLVALGAILQGVAVLIPIIKSAGN